MAVTDGTEGDQTSVGTRGAKIPIALGFVLGIALGAGGFFFSYNGFTLDTLSSNDMAQSETLNEGSSTPVFIPLDPMVVSLGTAGASKHLRFQAQIEVVPGLEEDVTAVIPRIVDTLNGYLRAVPIEELEAPAALFFIRAQMLRRIQLLTPEGAVRDLLIMEFVLS